jgi:very-short-patch-repair endonuclease
MPRVGRIASPCVPEIVQPPIDVAIRGLAARQYGVVSLEQLRGVGLSASAVRKRVSRGRLCRLHRGVYAVGHPVLKAEGRWLAATLACGSGAVLSHGTAADALGLRPSDSRRIDITVPSRGGRARTGIELHRSATLTGEDVTTVSDIPCTSVARTLIDLAEVVDRRALERACERAEILRVFDRIEIEEDISRAKGRKGAALLAAVLNEDHHALEAPTRQELEKRFFRLCERSGIPRPRVNHRVEGFEVDFCWPAERLIVETDGWETHGTRRAFERDRARDRRLTEHGWRVVRFTWRQLESAPAALHALLQRYGEGGIRTLEAG